MVPLLIGWLIALAVVPPFLICLVSLYPVRRHAAKLGLVAKPGGHSTHTNTTPVGGGIGIWLGIMVPMLLGTALVLLSNRFPTLANRLPVSIVGYFAGISFRLPEL